MKKGFTLIELSVVMVIIGLIIGAILAGVSLVRSAELRSIMTEQSQIQTAVNGFISKFNGLPGDIANATTFFGTTDSSGNTINNGNVNGKIDYYLGSPVLPSSEEYSAWQHLALAGLIPGIYSGTTTSLPKSKVNVGYYRISYQTNVYGQSANMISINTMNQTLQLADSAILSPTDVYTMDLKSDDGLASSGQIMGFNPTGQTLGLGTSCVSANYSSSVGNYNIPSNNILCKVFFLLGN